MSATGPVTKDSWKHILASAVAIFNDVEKKGLGSPDVVVGGGTVLMFRFEHRLSKVSIFSCTMCNGCHC